MASSGEEEVRFSMERKSSRLSSKQRQDYIALHGRRHSNPKKNRVEKDRWQKSHLEVSEHIRGEGGEAPSTDKGEVKSSQTECEGSDDNDVASASEGGSEKSGA